MAIIYTRKGEEILVDDEDYGWLGQFTWHVSEGYARTNVRQPDGRYRGVQMHRMIAGVKGRKKVDHKNTKTLDNRRDNLRPCSHGQNLCNTKVRSNSRSGFKGVGTLGRRFYAHIRVGGKRVRLGWFDNSIDAAEAYDTAAKKHFGEFARTNKMMGLLGVQEAA